MISQKGQKIKEVKMKKYLAILLSLVLVFSLMAGAILFEATPAQASPGTYYVSTSGNNSDDGSLGNPWLTIQYACDNVSPGDTIKVMPGTYSGNITITKPLTLLSTTGSANTTIDAAGLGTNAVSITSDNVTLGRVDEGFTITGANTTGKSGIVLNGSNCRIDSDNITGNTHGLYINMGSNNRVLRNTITDNSGHGVHLPGITEWNDVAYNDITNNGLFGVYAEPVQGDIYWRQCAGFNYWGDVSGPGGSGPGTGDKVNQYVWCNPWLNSSFRTILDSGIANISLAIPLEVGWNTLSTPLALASDSNNWDEIVSSSNLSYSQAFTYSPTSGWGELATDNTTALNPLDALFIQMTEDSRVTLKVSTSTNPPPTKVLSAGWNLIGSSMTVTDRELEMWKVLKSVDLTAAGLVGYDMVVSPPLATQPTWVYVRGQEEVSGFEWEKMDFGRGYWIYMENQDEMAGFGSTPITARVWD